MTEHLAFLILGLGSGAAIALLACGVVLTDRASGVINFAHAATGMYLSSVFYEFRATGEIVLPIVGLPARIPIVPRPTVATAVVVVGLYAAAFGALLYVVIFRRLSSSPPLARLVASIGLFLYLWASAGLRFPTAQTVPHLLPSSVVYVLGHPVFQDRLWAAGIAVAVAIGLWAVFRFTRFGLATIAAAESPKGAALTGLNRERLALVNWMLATLLAGAAAVLIAPLTLNDPLNTSLLIVPVLAATLLGGGRSFIWVTVAALGIGMAQSELQNLQPQWTALSGLGLQQGLPFLVILAVLIARGRNLPGRGDVDSGRLPASPEPHRIGLSALACCGAGIAVALLGDADWRAAAIYTSIAVVMSLSLVVLTGFIGQISLAPYALAGVAAFSLSKLDELGVPFPLAPVGAVGIAAVIGLIVGVPATKVRGMNLAIATLGAAVAIEQLLFKWRWFVDAGSTRTPAPRIGPLNLGISAPGDAYPRSTFVVAVVLVATASAVAVANLRRGRTGLAWLAVRANERAAAGTGVDVRGAKILAFAVSAVLAGIGGVLLNYQHGTLSVDSFQVFLSLALLALTYLAGISSVSGAVIAGVLAPLGVLTVALGQDLTKVSPYTYVINAMLLIVAALAYPSGIAGSVARWRHRLVRTQHIELVPAR